MVGDSVQGWWAISDALPSHPMIETLQESDTVTYLADQRTNVNGPPNYVLFVERG